MLTGAECSEFILKCGDKRSAGESATINYFGDGPIELIAQRRVLSLKIEKRNFYFHNVAMS